MMDFCMLSKDNVLGGALSDKEVSVLVALMKYKLVNKQFVYSRKYFLDTFCVSGNNSTLKKHVDNAITSLSDKGYVIYTLISDFGMVDIQEIAVADPFQKVYYKDFDKIFSHKTKLDKFKILLVYLNIIKWFHGDNGYAFPTNERLMTECDIKSETSLMAIQKCLSKDLKLLKIESHSFDVDGANITKNFYGYTKDSIKNAIETYTTTLSWGYIKKVNQELANKKRSEKMKLYHQNKRKGIV